MIDMLLALCFGKNTFTLLIKSISIFFINRRLSQNLKFINYFFCIFFYMSIITIITHVKKEFDGIDFATLKNNEQFILHVCEIVENIFTEKRIKKRKKEFVLKIIIGIIVDITDNDRRVIEEKIEFLHSNNVIKKVPIHTKAWNNITSVFAKKS